MSRGTGSEVDIVLPPSQETGPHLFEFSPSGVTYEYYAMAIGARSQSAKTYLERHFEEFPDCMCMALLHRLLRANPWGFTVTAGSLDDLIMHGLNALRDTLQQDKELSTLNTSIATVGPASISAILSQSLIAQAPPEPTLDSMTLTTSNDNAASLFTPIKSIQATSGSSDAFLADKFNIIESEALQPYLERMPVREGAAPAGIPDDEPLESGAHAPTEGTVLPGTDNVADGGSGNMQTDP